MDILVKVIYDNEIIDTIYKNRFKKLKCKCGKIGDVLSINKRKNSGWEWQCGVCGKYN